MSAQAGRGGMGMKKHGQSGYATKSPRFRFWAKMEAEKNERRPKKQIMFGSIKEAIKAAEEQNKQNEGKYR